MTIAENKLTILKITAIFIRRIKKKFGNRDLLYSNKEPFFQQQVRKVCWYFLPSLSDNCVDLSVIYADVAVIYVDLSDH